MMFVSCQYVRVLLNNCTGMVIGQDLIGCMTHSETVYLVLVKQGKGNEKLKEYFKDDLVLQCLESQLESVCLN